MYQSANGGFTNATDLADYLVKKGVPFRDAHGIVGRIVLSCIDKDCAIDALSLEQLQAFAPEIGEDVYEAIAMETCVRDRQTFGAPGAMEEILAVNEAYITDKHLLGGTQ